MARKRYSIYKLTAPSGRAYVGFTSQSVEERWRQHVGRAMRGAKHPLCDSIRKHGRDAFSVEVLATYDDADEALRAEVAAIAGLEDAYNLSPGGEFDGGAGAVRFRELLTDPAWREAYCARLSAALKSSSRFKQSRERIEGLLAAWREDNPKKAYLISLRNLRIGRNKSGRREKPPAKPQRLPRKPKGPAAKLHKSIASREAAKRHWAEMNPATKAEIVTRIAASLTDAHAAKTEEERQRHNAQLAEARKSIDHEFRKARQKEALTAYWTPERRTEFGAKVKARRAAKSGE